MLALAISLFLLTSAYADDELLIISDRIAQKQAELNKFQEVTRALIINKSLDIEEAKQQLKEVRNEESNSTENNQGKTEDKK